MGLPTRQPDDLALRLALGRMRKRGLPCRPHARFVGLGIAAALVTFLDGCASSPAPSATSPAPLATGWFDTPAALVSATRQDSKPAQPEAGSASAASAQEPAGAVQEPAAPAPAQPGPPEPTAAPSTGGATTPHAEAYPIHGSLSSVYRGRFSGGDHDHDITEVLSVDFGDPARNDWTGHLMTRVSADLDGRPSGPSPFHDLNDTYDAFLVPHLYDAWVQKRDVGALDHVRIGRQSLWDTPVFAWFDGLGVETKATDSHNVVAGLYGGIPVHLYENSHSGDFITGAYAQGEPWKNGRVRLDWMHLEDQGSVAFHSDDLWRASAWQSFGRNVRIDGWFSGLDGTERDFMARATWTDAESDFNVSASWFELLTTQQDLSLELDPYFTTLGELFPYHQARLVASKGFGQHVNLQSGVDVRDVSDEDDEGRFNRDTNRIFATVTLTDLLPGHIDMNVTGERWDGDGSDIDTWGFDLSRRFGEKFSASLGSYYALYKVESFFEDEHDHVRTGYLRLRWRRTEKTTWDARYDIEDAADTTYQTVRLGLTWNF